VGIEYGSINFHKLREGVMGGSAKAILGVGVGSSGPLAQCSPLRSTADNDAIEQTSIKQTNVAQLYLLGAVGAS
jgi:hypothetical protein